jgi:L-proline amide hydrolase
MNAVATYNLYMDQTHPQTELSRITWGRNSTYTLKRSGATKPTLFVPGGPGLPHNYLINLKTVSGIDLNSVFFDPLGSGYSSMVVEPTIDKAIEELGVVFSERINTSSYMLFAHSSGGWIALEAIGREVLPIPDAMILASSGDSVSTYLKEARKLLYQIGAWEYFSVWLGSQNPFYKQAYKKFVDSHVIRHPAPAILKKARRRASYSTYHDLWGENELFPDGELKDFEVSRLDWVAKTNLLTTHGKYDHVPVVCSKNIRSFNSSHELHTFNDSAHYPHLEQPKKYKKVVGGFWGFS